MCSTWLAENTGRKKSPFWHHRTTLWITTDAIFIHSYCTSLQLVAEVTKLFIFISEKEDACTKRLTSRVWLPRLRDCDAGRRPAARRFVRDAQSAVRLPVSRSRLRLDRLTGSHTALWASWTNGLAAGRRPASRSRSRGNHTREVSYVIQCIRRRALTYLVVATPTPAPFAFLSVGTTRKPASVSGSTWRRKMAQCRQALQVVQR